MSQFKIKLSVLKTKICLCLCNNFIPVKVLGILFPGLKRVKKSHVALLGLFWMSNNIFIITDQCRLFYFQDRSWYSDECARRLHYISCFGSLGFSFHLKQKQSFSIWSFTENANFISFHGKLLSRYSEINKFETSKDLTFQK